MAAVSLVPIFTGSDVDLELAEFADLLGREPEVLPLIIPAVRQVFAQRGQSCRGECDRMASIQDCADEARGEIGEADENSQMIAFGAEPPRHGVDALINA